MEHGSFEDVLPIKNGDIPASYVLVNPQGTSFFRWKWFNQLVQVYTLAK